MLAISVYHFLALKCLQTFLVCVTHINNCFPQGTDNKRRRVSQEKSSTVTQPESTSTDDHPDSSSKDSPTKNEKNAILRQLLSDDDHEGGVS